MRLAVLSDIHGNLIALNAVLADLKQQGDVDLIWCPGDLAAFGTRPAECIQRIRALIDEHGKEKVKVIGGNTDRYLVTGKRPIVPAAKDAEGFQRRITAFKERDIVLNWTLAQLTWDDYEFLAKIIGREIHTHIEGYGTVIGFHAIPGDDEPVSLKPDSPEEEALDALLDRAGRLAIAGHTHLKMDRILKHWRVVNPGSIGMSFSAPGMAEWALLTFDNGDANVDLRAVPYDLNAAIAEANTTSYPMPGEWLARRLNPGGQ